MTTEANHGPSIRRSTLINLLGALIPAALLLVTVPLYLHRIGEARYGVLALVWLLLGYFGVFDLGFGRAVANRIATLHDASAEKRQDIFWTGLVISLSTGLIGGVALYFLGDWLFAQVFHVPTSLRGEAEAALPWLILALPLATTISLLAGALEGRQAFLSMTSAQVAGTILYQVLPLTVAYAGWVTLPYLIPAAIAGRSVSAVLLFLFSYRQVPLAPRPRFAASQVRSLLHYGGWITVTGLVSPLLTVFDRFFIGAKLGMTAVAAYTIPYNLVSYLSILPGSLQTALFPRFAMLSQNQAQSAAARAVLLLIAILTPAVVVALLLVKPFLYLWIGSAVAQRAAPVGQILLLGIWINALAYVPFAYLQARGRPDLPAKFHVLELLPYALVLWLLITQLGIVGAAWAWTLRVFADALLLFWSAKTVSTLRRAVPASVLLLGVFAIAIEIPYRSFAYLGLGTVLVLGATGWSVAVLPTEVRAVIRRYVGHLALPW